MIRHTFDGKHILKNSGLLANFLLDVRARRKEERLHGHLRRAFSPHHLDDLEDQQMSAAKLSGNMVLLSPEVIIKELGDVIYPIGGLPVGVSTVL